MTRRIAITGLGVLSPIGSGHDVFWGNLCEGHVGTARIEAFDVSIFDTHNGGEVRDADPRSYLKQLNPAETPRTTQLAAAAARMALEDSGLNIDELGADRVGVCIGTTMGNISVVEDNNDIRVEGTGALAANLVAHMPEAYISAAVATELGAEGPCLMVPTACAAGNYAISWGSDLIRDGLVDAALVGGSDAISRACYSVFNRLGALAPEVCQPFEKNRKGTMVSEGAAVILLEDMDHAISRGATIYAELLGYGLACDAHHPTAPHPQGMGAALAINSGLADAGLTSGQVSYISAHGTGTKANDATESQAIRNIFGELADEIPVSSIKGMMGHTMGAASAIEAVACSLAIQKSMLPPTVNYEEADPECVKNIVPNKAVEHPVKIIVSNAFAFGGNISIIVLGEVNHVA
ncbi:beta-ketoacyl-[acyl-carrier-protein] synthase family protein [Paenibacillus oenotherae]|uniref:Beta-ketoacyl-[acyl-carrier-protein] synthase family protein n=1 Tax=Paenibacillus oenotherae TaxID=1435645 RepID=A0ABS7DCR4_9BACL|nr:beta-ketoacyl-[acyl-carrier-protein] synthase family protein [Paenibacillus oenotherae]MBW7476948.1 beta-ketoacyl-[acyl-carrier-protein] synthase family protein [Paenibacillus oenotherae]